LIAVNAGKLALVALCREEAASHVVRGQFELAIPAAQYALRFSTSVYGDGSVELVPAYLLIAEANLGLARYRQAEEQLTLANWALLKAPHGSNALRSQLRRNFGRLYASQSKFAEALRQLADDVYYSSLMVGPEHIDTSGGYFQLGNVFYSMNKIENALAMYDKVVDIWYKYLTNLHAARDDAAAMAAPEKLTEEQLADGRSQLEQVLETRSRLLGHTHIATGEAQYTIGLFEYFLLGNERAAESFIVSAQKTYESTLGEAHASSQHVLSILILIRQRAVGVGGSTLDGDSLLVA
jgi:tetratricopeptide (TPR) repeat protein